MKIGLGKIKPKKKVCIVGPRYVYDQMFQQNDWDIVDTLAEADLLQFTGGPDVTPAFYHHHKMNCTKNDERRDEAERTVFKLAYQMGIPMAGICRGGQFLNVMCGGTMWQEVDGHALSGTHQVFDTLSGEMFNATSTHHQMMIPGHHGKVIAYGNHISRRRERGGGLGGGGLRTILAVGGQEDPEVVWYPDDNILCFQPHPEFTGQNVLRRVYLDYVDKLLLQAKKKGEKDTCVA